MAICIGSIIFTETAGPKDFIIFRDWTIGEVAANIEGSKIDRVVMEIFEERGNGRYLLNLVGGKY